MLYGHQTVLYLEHKFGINVLKTHYTITQMCAHHTIPAVKKDNKWYIPEDFIEQCEKWYANAISLTDCIAEAIKENQLDEEAAQNFRQSVQRRFLELPVLDVNTPENRYGKIFSGVFVSKKYESVVHELIDLSIKKHLPGYIAVNDVAQKLGISPYVCKHMLNLRQIPMEFFAAQNYIAEQDFVQLQDDYNSYIGIYDIACRAYADLKQKQLPLFFDPENTRDRTMLNTHLRHGQLSASLVTPVSVGLVFDRRNALIVSKDMETIFYDYIADDLLLFGKRDEYLKKLMGHPYWASRPLTYESVAAFSKAKPPGSLIIMIIVIIENVKPELMDLDNNGIHTLLSAKRIRSQATAKKMLANYITYVSTNYDCKFTIQKIKNDAPKRHTIQSQPYARSQYFQMAYMVFNDNYITQERLIRKAMNHRSMAEVWLYTAFMYIAAWRPSDLEQLPILPLASDIDVIRQEILDASYGQKAVQLCDLLMSECNNRNLRPHKTEKRNSDRYLLITIPETLKSVFGTIYTICLLHNELDQRRVYSGRKYAADDFARFFGSNYRIVFGNTPFSSRRANKAYLDLLLDVTNADSNVQSKVYGYQIAALARAHTKKIYQLPSTTAIYLSCKMDGLSIDQAFHHLWNNGTCGFIPHMLLDAIYEDKYATLPFAAQTQIISYQNLDAYETEFMLEAVQRAYLQATNIIKSLFFELSDDARKEKAKQILERLLQHSAESKTANIHCLLMAIDRPCLYPARNLCFGCPYAIAEKSVWLKSMQVLQDYFALYSNAKTEGSQKKYHGLLYHSFLPAVMDLLAMLKRDYHVDISKHKQELIRLIKEGKEKICCNEEKH